MVKQLIMTVDEFIVELQRLRPDLRSKEIVITCPNGLQVNPVIKQGLIDQYNLFGGVENVKNMVITYQ